VSEPVGLELTRTAKAVGRAFDAALAGAGGSLPVWLVLLSVKAGQHGTQRDIAAAVGIEGPTLTHHLNRMEAAGLLTRARDPRNRRVHQVALTEAGEALFGRLRETVVAFDARLRGGLSAEDATTLRRLLGTLRANVTEFSSR
jgi:MarR family transcriptional regulator, transcriptional regulator for hemolysin